MCFLTLFHWPEIILTISLTLWDDGVGVGGGTAIDSCVLYRCVVKMTF